MIGAALVAANSRSRDANRTRSDRVQGLGPTDTAISTYRFALQARKASDATGWVPDLAGLTSIVGDDAKVFSNTLAGPYAVVDTDPANGYVPVHGRLTVSIGTTAAREFWQIYRVQPPDGGSDRDLRVWFRAWTGNADPTTGIPRPDTASSNARMVVATFRQGRFSDFQMLANGPIRFDTGGVIRGPVHSNGYLDGVTKVPDDMPTARVFADTDATITCPAAGAAVTTASGTVSLPASCPLIGDGQPTGRYVSFQGLSKTFTEMAARCYPTGDVYCFTTGLATYNVELLNRNVRVNGIDWPLDRADRTITAVLLDGNVRIRGMSRGRLTVAAYNRGRVGAAPSMITIERNVGTPVNAQNVAQTRGESLGLFAQGDIVATPENCANMNLIHGVLISGSGSFTIGRERMSAQPPTPTPTPCPRLVLSGAVASNSAPQLSWRWPDRGAATGFSERTYVWDTALRDAPPPYVPVTGTWESASWKNADTSCLTTGASDPNCV